jgi:hypothetical protein
MSTVEEVWRTKTDEQVTAAAGCLEEYGPEGQRAILEELRRRDLPEPLQSPSPRQRDSGWEYRFSFLDFVSYLVTLFVYFLVSLFFFLLGFKPSVPTLLIPGPIFIYLFQPSVRHYVTQPVFAALSVRDRPMALGILCWTMIVACMVVLGHSVVQFQLSASTVTPAQADASVLDPHLSFAEAMRVRLERANDFWMRLLPSMGTRSARAVVYLICAVGMLRGRNWARWLFVGFSAFDWMYGAVVSRAIVIASPLTVLGAGVWLASVYYLARPETSRFFLRDGSNAV